MSRRIDIQDYEIPTHLDEVGYLNDLSIAIKTLLHDIEPNEYTPQIDFVMLARWEIEHAPKLFDYTCGDVRRFWTVEATRKAHKEAAYKISKIISKLMDGLKTDNPIRDITQADIDTISEVRAHLEQCKQKVVWYR